MSFHCCSLVLDSGSRRPRILMILWPRMWMLALVLWALVSPAVYLANGSDGHEVRNGLLVLLSPKVVRRHTS